ncbi:hypothetical protein Cycma_1204 [Cyclobacterium marinum DSM 745]|uniref:Uncharacterized protein n=1 Tax=Cyclobacterium marinum (strain ATCC 25205 / DSM 745 / LMG 13164 / NCIMB 1802) TaxID=880070 RepID=G0IY72_CYCMS|nr:hypothetical protein Cycma_1204 [Cyclobacterium marinum DSM 745]
MFLITKKYYFEEGISNKVFTGKVSTYRRTGTVPIAGKSG